MNRDITGMSTGGGGGGGGGGGVSLTDDRVFICSK